MARRIKRTMLTMAVMFILSLMNVFRAFCADNIKTVGATGADYTSLADWEADLDDGTNADINTTAYGSGDVAICELIDSTLTGAVTINGGGTSGLSKIIIRPEAGNEHTGELGTGATIAVVANNTWAINLTSAIDLGIYDTCITTAAVSGNYAAGGVYSPIGNGADITIARCIIANESTVRSAGKCCGIRRRTSTGLLRVMNSLITGFDSSSGSDDVGNAILAQYVTDAEIDQVTVTGSKNGIRNQSSTNTSIRNSVSVGNDVDFSTAGSWDTVTDVLSGDGTHPTGGATATQSLTDQFVDPSGGDFTPKPGSELIGAGTDLGTSPVGVNIDLKGRDRDAEGDAWDIGAIQSFSAGGSAVPAIIQQLYKGR